MMEDLAEREEESIQRSPDVTPATPVEEEVVITSEDNTYENLVSYLSNNM
jgi:hypothetical protein